MLQEFIDKNFYRLLLFTLIFGVIFYDTIGFAYTDEICSLILFILYLKYIFSTPKWEINKMFIITTAVFLFYLFYSFYINSNTKAGIITDFVIQYKPYLGFFCVYAIKPRISPVYKKLICEICIVLGFYLLGIGILYLVYPDSIKYTLKHPSRLATAVSIVSLLYLYCSNFTEKDKIIFVLLLLTGMFSARSKFYGFFIISVALLIFTSHSSKIKINFKTITLLSITALLVIAFTYKKINLYFLGGGDFVRYDEKIQDTIARAALYFYSTDVFIDFFPFGSGFASYATYASGIYYSDIYNIYGLDNIYGLTKGDAAFISDTYYPALAQFGIVGVILFFTFWGNLGIQTLKKYRISPKDALLALMIIIFFLIECTSDSTITHNRGLFMMMLLGLILSDLKRAQNNYQTKVTINKSHG
ncbi:O-antigen ligase domain-containing protein [Parabacteroides sp. AM08-6]|nr:O-antigen ligase domain-containing protein [Parabacteroides sp. AM08-6]